MRAIYSLKTRRDREDGFTLIELMVVVLIIAILIAIAIPTFLGMRQRAQDSAAKSDLRNALAAVKTHYTDNETYAGVAVADLDAIEPSIDFVAGNPAAGSGDTGFFDASATGIVLVRESKAGSWFGIAEVATGATAGTYYCKTAAAATPAAVDTVAECIAVAGASGDNW